MPCPERERLAHAALIVIKVGSAVIADTAGLKIGVIASLASQIADLRAQKNGRKIIIVSSGAVAAGRAIMAQNGSPVISQNQAAKQALAAIGQARLMQAWSAAFQKAGIIVAQALLTRADFHNRERFQYATDTFQKMLSWGVIPIVNENDTVSVHELKFGDNDTLASLIVNLAQADLFINLTSAPGVLAENPELNPSAPVLENIEDIRSLDIGSLCGNKTSVGSGGMYSKLLAARRVAQIGAPTLILPGQKENVILEAFACASSTQPGTMVYPDEKAISRRKFWLAYQSPPKGTIQIDSGAAEALLERGKSLLPGGVTALSGNFAKGDLVKIEYEGKALAVGFCNYSSDELGRIHGLKRHEIAAILGNAEYPDVVHRDNMLLDVAV